MNDPVLEWPRPRIGWAACVEAAGRWWLVTTIGILLLATLLAGLQRAQAQSLREARLEIALQSLRERLETNLTLGFELADSHHAQAMLEDVLADDPTLLAAEVFDAGAISLFNTDRGAIGERVPASWLLASSTVGAPVQSGRRDTASRAWTLTEDEGFTLGVPVRGPFGELAGHVSITSNFPPAPSPWPLLGVTLVAWAVMTAALAWLGTLMLRGLAEQRDDDPVDAAVTRLSTAHGRIAEALGELNQDRKPA